MSEPEATSETTAVPEKPPEPKSEKPVKKPKPRKPAVKSKKVKATAKNKTPKKAKPGKGAGKKTRPKAKVEKPKPAKVSVKKTKKIPTKAKRKRNMTDYLCPAQERILKALRPYKRPISAALLQKEARIATSKWLSEYMGVKESAHDGYIFRTDKKTGKGMKTPIRKLVPAGLVKRSKLVDKTDGTNRVQYELTPAGRSKLEKLLEESKKTKVKVAS